MILFNK